jgi:hypothetical protein
MKEKTIAEQKEVTQPVHPQNGEHHCSNSHPLKTIHLERKQNGSSPTTIRNASTLMFYTGTNSMRHAGKKGHK